MTLKVPKWGGVLPTPDKVRLAIFNSLGPTMEGARVLEVFAGTGALGLEALSEAPHPPCLLNYQQNTHG